MIVDGGLGIISLSQLVFVMRNNGCWTFCLCSFQNQIVSIKDKHPPFTSIQSKTVSHQNGLLHHIACFIHSGFLPQTLFISKIVSRLIWSEIKIPEKKKKKETKKGTTLIHFCDKIISQIFGMACTWNKGFFISHLLNWNFSYGFLRESNYASV